jgi:hypothetical protein
MINGRSGRQVAQQMSMWVIDFLIVPGLAKPHLAEKLNRPK